MSCSNQDLSMQILDPEQNRSDLKLVGKFI